MGERGAHPRLVFYTVGGSSEPILFSIRQNRPGRAIFIVSGRTRGTVDQILGVLESENTPIPPGAVRIVEVRDAEGFGECVRAIARLADEVDEWRERGPEYEVVADLTGGTKCMSAALALVAQRWPCTYSYVGGTQRDRGGVGIVQEGSERLLLSVNPWEALGYQAVEDALVLLGRHDYAGGRDTLEQRKCRIAESDGEGARVKRQLATLESLCTCFAWWDIFEHQKAAHVLGSQALKNYNDLAVIFPGCEAELQHRLRKLQEVLDGIIAEPRGRKLVVDLLGNAKRCCDRGRFDDGVARLYRVLEAAAQQRIGELYGGAETGAFPAGRLPGELAGRWAARVEQGSVRLGLQDAYELLGEEKDAMAERFRDRGLHNPSASLLVSRNQSILGHGFSPIGEKAFHALWRACLEVVGVEEAELAEFPGPWLAAQGKPG